MYTTRMLQDRILQLKKEKNICILAHAYQSQDIWEVADYVGDSYGLSLEAAKSDAQTVLMCGVRFMAETVKILSPEKKVLLSHPQAGCPMATQMDVDLIRQLKEQHPDYAVAAYINTTAELKTVCDVCVTSSSAVKVIKNMEEEMGFTFFYTYQRKQKLADAGVNTIGLPGTIDLDIACTDYTIGFDTAVNTAMQAIDKIRDTSTSHERCSIIEVMGRNAGYIALWCGIANGAEDILLPERYDGDEQAIINHIIDGRKKGKKHHLIINAEGIGHSTGMARRIEAATGIETRATILGYMQRGGSPTCKDRMYASIMGSYAVDLLVAGKSNRLVAYKNGKFVDYDIDEALAMTKDISEYEFNISSLLSN